MIDRARTTKRGTAGRDVRETHSVYLGLRRCGLSIAEAGNLTARLEGIHAVPGGWTLRDVERLQFLRWLITSGRFGADDMIAGRVGVGWHRIVEERPPLGAYGPGGSGTTMSRAAGAS
jgi:hypothetical protein